MADLITLENIVETVLVHKHGDIAYHGNYCPVCGQKIRKLALTKEYTCEKCRHLVSLSDEFCTFCGDRLSDNQITEHYLGGVKLTDELFTTIKVKINANK